MIIVRANKDKKSLTAFNTYLRLPDGTEHEIPGVILIKQFPDKLPVGAYAVYAVEFHIDDHAVKFE